MRLTLRSVALASLTSVIVAILVTPASATPPAVSLPGTDDVAATIVKIDQARKGADVATLRTLIALPLKVTSVSHNPGGDCNVPHNKTVPDPAKAAAALGFPAAFVTALQADKGHAHAGAYCPPDGTRPYSGGEISIVVTGNQATVTVEPTTCGNGDPTTKYILARQAGVWHLTTLDNGCSG